MWNVQEPIETDRERVAQPTGRIRIPAFLDRLPSDRFQLHFALSVLTFFALLFAILVTPQHTAAITHLFFLHDLPWVIVFTFFVILIGYVPCFDHASLALNAGAKRLRLSVILLASVVLAVGLVGSLAVYHGFALSRDEAMAQFDAAIISRGHLIAAVPSQWRQYVDALEPLFLLPVRDHTGWVSSYLPVHAAIRAAFGLVASPLLAGPAMAAVSVIAIVGVARRLWPTRPDAALVAGLILVSSTQTLVTAMTPYAMTAHLTLNLLWMWLFVRDSKWTHLGAILIGALATGLHQLVFHPLFALPFILSLWYTRRLRLAALYTVSYAIIAMAWVFYWQVILHANGMEGANGAHASAFVGRVLSLLGDFDATALQTMLQNIVRFLTWQNPIMLPLMIAAFVHFRKMPPLVGLATAGIVITLALVFVVLPFQGQGWGYRYLHGFLGSFALLAAQGWISLTTDVSDVVKRRLASQVLVAVAFGLLIVLPVRAYETEAFVAPFAKANDLIRHADSDVVFVDPNGLPYAIDLVRNDPFLETKPFVFSLWALSQAQIRVLCATHDVSVFDEATGQALHLFFHSKNYIGPSAPGRETMRQIGCGRPIERTTGP